MIHVVVYNHLFCLHIEVTAAGGSTNNWPADGSMIPLLNTFDSNQ